MCGRCLTGKYFMATHASARCVLLAQNGSASQSRELVTPLQQRESLFLRRSQFFDGFTTARSSSRCLLMLFRGSIQFFIHCSKHCIVPRAANGFTLLLPRPFQLLPFSVERRAPSTSKHTIMPPIHR